MNLEESLTNSLNRSYNVSHVLEYIYMYRGSQMQPLETIIPLTFISVVIFILGMIGNIAVCVVIAKHPLLQTPSNYFLLNLSISDTTLLLFGLPYDVVLYWHQYPWVFGETMCKGRALISEMSTYVSVMTIAVFSTERYIAICKPMHLNNISEQRTLKIIAVLWVIAFMCASPFASYTEVNYLYYPPNSSDQLKLEESALCAMTSQPEYLPIIQLSFIIFFIVPMFLIVFQYFAMTKIISNALKDQAQNNLLNGSVQRTKIQKRAKNNQATIRTLLAVVIGFFICWAPFHFQRLLILYGKDLKHIQSINNVVYFITGALYYLSATLNPIFYNVTSKRMRLAFMEVCCCKPDEKMSRNVTFSSNANSSRKTCRTSVDKAKQGTSMTYWPKIDPKNDDNNVHTVV